MGLQDTNAVTDEAAITKDFCVDLAKRIQNTSDLPVSCLKHLDLEARTTETARDRRMASQAKLQRRMTGGISGRYTRGKA
jgi:plasmid maintenance system antidote protein VapI